MPYVWWNWQTEKPYKYRYKHNKKEKKEMSYTRPEIEKLIDERIIGNKAIRNRQILKDKLIDGRTYEDVAERYDLTDRQVKRIVKKLKTQLFH